MRNPVQLLTIMSVLIALLALSCGTDSPKSSPQKEEAETARQDEKPDTAASNANKREPASTEELSSVEDVTKKGMTIANKTFAMLSTELSRAINAGGIQSALDYCKLNAYPLVDSISQANNAYVKRTSLKLRNPNNIPGPEEEAILKLYESAIDKEGNVDFSKLRPRVKDKGDHWAFYAPITLRNPVCLKCHGKIGLDIKNEDYAKIRELYPQDKANGYELGDLRGIWSIQFKK